MFLPPPESLPWPAPLMGAPTALLLLLLLFAIAVYLRTVAENATRFADDILEGARSGTYPEGVDHTITKIEDLDRTRRWTEGLVGWVLVPLAILTALRIMAQSLSLVSIHLYARLDWLNPWFRRIDLALAIVLFVLLCVLWRLHLTNVRRETDVRGQMLNYREKSLKKSRIAD